jgi:ATP-dependent exoDNAse (exonuclease V) alpha subunit
MVKLFEVAEAVGARVILVGDRRQNRSVTAGEPLKLLEDAAGLKVAEVTEILRQKGNYKKAAEALGDGRVLEGFEELQKLGWIKQVADSDRYKQLAAAYLAAAAEKKKNGQVKTAIVVSPTHAEADRISKEIRLGLRARGKLGDERLVDVWVPTHLTDAQKADPTQYEAGDLVQFHQNAPGFKKGSRLVVGEGVQAPTEVAN